MRAFTLWIVGAPGAAKAALARALEGALLERGAPVEIVDGGEMGANLRIGLGASADDEATYARRIGFLCRILSRNGIVAIATEVAPREPLCDEARAAIDRFVEVRLAAPGEAGGGGAGAAASTREACANPAAAATGVAGAGASAASGRHEVVVTVDPSAEEESARKILSSLEALGYLAPPAGRDYSSDEEEEIKSRLRDLGYI